MSNADQIEYWNGVAGERWATLDERMARLLHPVAVALLEHATPGAGGRVMDIGCGGGSQSLLLAEALGSGEVVGVDVSAPLLEVARSRPQSGGATMSFIEADASSYAFEPQSFDALFSRFGVMFFDDPAAAFGNLRSAVKPGGELVFVCWRGVSENPWIALTLQAALKHLPPPPPQPEGAPGPFAFADPERVNTILASAGFESILLQPWSFDLVFDAGTDLSSNVREMASIGPVSRMLEGVEAPVMQAVLDEIEAAVGAHYADGALRLPGSVWFVTASNPG